MKYYALFLAVLSVSGCQTSAGASKVKDDSATVSWQRILTCDGGAEHFDVNTNDRTSIQLVANSTILDRFPADLYGRETGDGTQVLLVGQAPSGIFDPSQFQLAFAYGQSGETTPWDATRSGSSVKFRVLLKGLPYPQCETDDDTFPASCEQSNYIFNSCN